MGVPVEPHSESASIVEAEETLHARVHARVALGTGGLEKTVAVEDLDKDLIALRDAIGEAKPEDLPPLVEQMTRLSALRAKVGGSRTLPVDIDSPYFAHMVLREGQRTRDVLIGKRGFVDRKANVQIVDWRNAPISQVYYRYDEGDDFEEKIDGRVFEGIVDVRRNLSISQSNLRRIGAPQGTFIRTGDGAWLEAVGELAPTLQGGVGKAVRAPKPVLVNKKGKKGRATLGVHHGEVQRADKHLPEIAALIDTEQFDLITHPESGLIVIQGGAGSGKTTVALHRIAFLNFNSPRRFRPKRMLFVVPTSSLARYVSAVLPSLGVSGVPVVTYYEWASKQRKRLMRGTSGKYNASPPDTVSRLKKHPAMLPIISDYVASQSEEAGAAVAELAGQIGDKLLAEWRALGDKALVPRLRKLRRWAKQTLRAGERVKVDTELSRLIKRAEDIESDWAEMLTDRGLLRAGFTRHSEEAISDSAISSLVSWVLRQQDDVAAFEDDHGRPIESVDGRSLDDESAAGRFDREDDPIMLRLIQEKRGGLMAPDVHETWYEHVAIDEAQDRSALEVKVLLEATAMEDDDPLRRSVTIAGDTAQRLVFDNNFSDWAELLRHTGHGGNKVEEIVKPLRLSYRSTAEVMELARAILGPELAPEDPLVARSGAPVELHEFGDLGEAIAFLGDALRTLMLREPSASVAVVSRYAEQADAYYAGLQRTEVPNMRRVRYHEFSFASGVDVTDVSQVKGLEFDYVVMVDVNAETYTGSVESRHLLHIGATRAAHQLWLVSTGNPSKLLPDSVRFGS